jgi:hypothetical protein
MQSAQASNAGNSDLKISDILLFREKIIFTQNLKYDMVPPLQILPNVASITAINKPTKLRNSRQNRS